MYDQELVLEIASQIHKATITIMKRFEPVKSPRDFTDSEAGMEKLDGICMQLIAIGEGLKNLDKVTDRSLLPRYPEVDCKWPTRSLDRQWRKRKQTREEGYSSKPKPGAC